MHHPLEHAVILLNKNFKQKYSCRFANYHSSSRQNMHLLLLPFLVVYLWTNVGCFFFFSIQNFKEVKNLKAKHFMRVLKIGVGYVKHHNVKKKTNMWHLPDTEKKSILRNPKGKRPLKRLMISLVPPSHLDLTNFNEHLSPHSVRLSQKSDTS